ncbi:MAG: hypothetical protein GF317_01690 [Candidatus Lokiarchaeota archaeon]|nr:hypothetical protein [Candidatus Lokiarchaeota archaeon]
MALFSKIKNALTRAKNKIVSFFRSEPKLEDVETSYTEPPTTLTPEEIRRRQERRSKSITQIKSQLRQIELIFDLEYRKQMEKELRSTPEISTPFSAEEAQDRDTYNIVELEVEGVGTFYVRYQTEFEFGSIVEGLMEKYDFEWSDITHYQFRGTYPYKNQPKKKMY